MPARSAEAARCSQAVPFCAGRFCAERVQGSSYRETSGGLYYSCPGVDTECRPTRMTGAPSDQGRPGAELTSFRDTPRGPRAVQCAGAHRTLPFRNGEPRACRMHPEHRRGLSGRRARDDTIHMAAFCTAVGRVGIIGGPAVPGVPSTISSSHHDGHARFQPTTPTSIPSQCWGSGAGPRLAPSQRPQVCRCGRCRHRWRHSLPQQPAGLRRQDGSVVRAAPKCCRRRSDRLAGYVDRLGDCQPCGHGRGACPRHAGPFCASVAEGWGDSRGFRSGGNGRSSGRGDRKTPEPS